MNPYYSDDAVTIYHGDCREVAVAADVMVTDPPYGMGMGSWSSSFGDDTSGNLPSIQGEPRMNRSSDRVLDRSHTEARDEILRAWGDRPAAVFGNWRAPLPVGARWRLLWDKGYPGLGGFGPWRPSVEDIYILGVGWVGEPKETSIIRCGTPPKADRPHPNVKPIELMRRLIDWCPPGVIVDPFMGSGTTLRAAKDRGRRAVGVEIEERFCEIAARRMAQEVLDFGPVPARPVR